MTYQSSLCANAFSQKTIIVTGGGSGIGRCIAHELAALGARVVIFGRTLEKLQRVKLEIEQDGGLCDFRVGDIRDSDAVANNIKTCVEEFGAIHGLVNNAGGQFPANLEDISSNGFMAVIKSNLLGGFLVAKEVYKQSMKQDGGSIVNITADYFGGMPRMGHSGAARAGMENFTQTAAIEWAKSGVRVNSVAPGYIISSGMDSYEDPDMIKRIPKFGQSTPAGRMGTESEVSAAVCFLLSQGAAYVNGVTLRVDGGSSLCLSSPLSELEVATKNNEPFDGFHRSELPDILKNK
ncbi:MAG: SDR family oxidoreductase [Bermanella sp.]